MNKIVYSLLALTLLFSVSCTDEVEFSSNTEALGGFQIMSPKNSATYSLNSGTPNNTITFKWSEAKPGVSKPTTYVVNFFKVGSETPFSTFTSNSEGKLNELTITFEDLDNALASAGVDIGENETIQWQVVATNGDVEVTSGKSNVSLTRFASDGIKDFNLLLPDNNNVIKADIYGTPNSVVEFTWEIATTTSGAGEITYMLLFDTLEGDFSEPIKSFEITSSNSFAMTHKEIGENFADTPNVKWTVKATISDTDISLIAQPDYINWDVFVINELYLVGSHNGWNNSTANAFTSDGNGGFEIQVDLPNNAEFKFLPTLGSWNGDWGEDPTNPGSIIQTGERNVKITNAGRYIIKVDFPTLSFSVTEFIAPDNLFMVGSHNGWNNGDPTQQFNNLGNGVFTRVQAFNANAEFKMIPTSGSWSGDWGEDPANPGSIIQDGEQNIKVLNAGNYLVVVDFNTLTYKLVNINTLFMVGSHNGWNNADASQQFNTTGNGVFVRMQTFDANAQFKMILTSGSWSGDWGEDPNNPGKLIQDGEQNISVSVGGTYMVTIDFNTLTYNLKEVPTNLFLVGSPNGWNNGTAPAFTKVSDGLFEITQALTSSDEFKFLPTLGSWTNDWGESKKYSGMIVREGEQNAKSPGNGTFKITVDYNAGVFKVELN